MKKKYILLIIVIISMILVFGIHTKGDTKLDNVKLNNQVDKNLFAIMLEQEDGKYQESEDNTWPVKYTYNEEMSGCMDINGNKIEEEGILTFDNSTHQAIVSTSKTVYCYLYFDRDKEAPTITKFYVGNSEEQEYTNSSTIPFKITWSDEDVEKYCITEEETANQCEWHDVSETEISTISTIHEVDGELQLESLTEGKHIYYAYIEDGFGNQSTYGEDEITYDKTSPTLTKPVVEGDPTQDSIVVKTTITDAGSGIKEVTCSSGSGTCTCVVDSETTYKCTNSGLAMGATYKITVTAIDNANNSNSLISDDITTKIITAPGTKLEGQPNIGYELKGGMYRYQGDKDTINNNYICFGISDKQICIDNPDIYMYRIIGIVGEDCTSTDDRDCDDTVSKDMIKVIKQTSLKESTKFTFQWDLIPGDSDYDGNRTRINKRLNGESNGTRTGSNGDSNIFLNSDNSLYPYMKESTWTDKIVEKKWYNAEIGYKYLPNTASEVFKQEYGIIEAEDDVYNGTRKYKNEQSDFSFKIGLMSLSDYYWSPSSEGINCYSSSNQSTCKNSWLHISNNSAEASSYVEWTNTFDGSDVFDISTLGRAMTNTSSNLALARPAFYLNSNITLTGTGISSDPFIIQ